MGKDQKPYLDKFRDLGTQKKHVHFGQNEEIQSQENHDQEIELTNNLDQSITIKKADYIEI